MKKYAEDTYHRFPIFMQNILSSLYGAILYRERYAPPWKKYYQYLLETQFMSDEEIDRMQISLLKGMVVHAIDHVPHYQKTIQLKREDLRNFNSMEMLEELPILEKTEFRESAETCISSYYDKEKLIRIGTSGTTGTPLTIYISREARKMNYAFFERSKLWAGIKGFERSITFAGRPIVPAQQKGPPFWRSNVLFHNTLFSSYHLSRENLSYYVDRIRKIQPCFIDSYPSSISIIAKYIIENKIGDIRPKAIITSSETLLDDERENIEKAFGCPVYDQYGSAEQVVFACQCKKGSYHINPEYGFVEVLDGNNKPLKKGMLGEFACTGFVNRAMPLIRYKIGDMGILSDRTCDCGCNFPLIEKICGRTDDILITPDGKYVGRLDPVFKGVGHTIREAQIIQEKLDLITILVVKAPGYADKDGEHIVKELEKRMGPGMHYAIRFVDSIPKTETGKFRTVVRKIE